MTNTIPGFSWESVGTAESVHCQQHDAIEAVTLYVTSVAEDLRCAGIHMHRALYMTMMTEALNHLVRHGVDKIIRELDA